MNLYPQGDSIRAAIVQFGAKSAVTMEDVDYNTDRILEFMNRSVTGFPGLDMIIFPECCFQGMSPSQFIKVALKWDSDPIRRVQAKCKELGVWGVFNPWIKPDNGDFVENVGIIINDEGEIVHKYVKMNPYLPWEATHPGSGIPICNGPKGSKIALIICNDSNYLDIWREISVSEANLVIHVSHWMGPYEYSYQISVCGGAYFCQRPVLAANGVGRDEAFIYAGGSRYVDPYGKELAVAPLGIEWILDVNVNPVACEDAIRQTVSGNRAWEAEHRGASCPDTDGFGAGLDGYTIYSK